MMNTFAGQSSVTLNMMYPSPSARRCLMTRAGGGHETGCPSRRLHQFDETQLDGLCLIQAITASLMVISPLSSTA